MAKYDVLRAIDSAEAGVLHLLNKGNARRTENEPELRSFFWMLREGVIGPGHFQDLVASTRRN